MKELSLSRVRKTAVAPITSEEKANEVRKNKFSEETERELEERKEIVGWAAVCISYMHMHILHTNA